MAYITVNDLTYAQPKDRLDVEIERRPEMALYKDSTATVPEHYTLRIRHGYKTDIMFQLTEDQLFTFATTFLEKMVEHTIKGITVVTHDMP